MAIAHAETGIVIFLLKKGVIEILSSIIELGGLKTVARIVLNNSTYIGCICAAPPKGGQYMPYPGVRLLFYLLQGTPRPDNEVKQYRSSHPFYVLHPILFLSRIGNAFNISHERNNRIRKPRHHDNHACSLRYQNTARRHYDCHGRTVGHTDGRYRDLNVVLIQASREVEPPRHHQEQKRSERLHCSRHPKRRRKAGIMGDESSEQNTDPHTEVPRNKD